MRFALISQDPSHGVRFWINPEEGDATSFLNWVDVWRGFHFNYGKILDTDLSLLKHFDVVMMSGHPYRLADIKKIADYLKDSRTVSMFYPEGSIQLFDNSIDNFHLEVYNAWNSCDIVSAAEEDKISYYQAFLRSGSIARFIHVPLRMEMEQGDFFIPHAHKNGRLSMVYGDNNPNHPLVAVACAAKCGFDVAGVDINRGKLGMIRSLFPDTMFHDFTKLAQYPFLRMLGRCFLQFYPTEWIGTARQQISCAVTGTPCIGNHDSHTQRRLFPDLGKDIYDVDGMCEAAERLRDGKFYEKTARKAFQEVQFYSLENTKRRFMAAYEDALQIKERVSIAV